eukprot:8833054-Lingulodinium_polyedra.AAC.1
MAVCMGLEGVEDGRLRGRHSTDISKPCRGALLNRKGISRPERVGGDLCRRVPAVVQAELGDLQKTALQEWYAFQSS